MFDHKPFLKKLSEQPGIYQMFDEQQTLLYVGKAKNLKKRVSSYFNKTQQSTKTIALVKQIVEIKVILTHTENEALILENNLIKKHRPRYNILFRDDKSYPYIYVSIQDAYPRLDFYRGSTKRAGRFFGPYPSVLAVRHSLNLLQKLFKVRQCRDSFFRNRTRPCLQYQIKRCTAPCVKYISKEDYQKDVKHTVLLLEGKSQAVINTLQARMAEAAEKKHYELAAKYRDQIADLREVQASQHVSSTKGEMDVIAIMIKAKIACLQLLMVRQGQLLAKQTFFPKMPKDSQAKEILTAFVAQYYLNTQQPLPKQIILPEKLDEQSLLAESLSEKAGYKVQLSKAVRGEKKHLLDLAEANAKASLASHLAAHATVLHQLEALQEMLALEQMPSRIECFDISHTQGEATVASCVVFGVAGDIKQDYRRFNIKDITGGDDYAAMRQALLRHFTRIKTDEKLLPDLLVIDGGKAQLKQAEEVLEELQINSVAILGIAKGRTRKAGFETLFLFGRAQPVPFDIDSPAMHLLQHVRDEAHRFAITGHRGQRDKARKTSLLEEVEGVGAKRRQQLLKHFGGLQGIKRASIEDLMKVPGINRALATTIYERFTK